MTDGWRRLRVMVVQDFLRSGGTERQSVLLANGLSARGHEVSLLTFRTGGVLAPSVAPGVLRRALQGMDTGLDWFAPGLRRAVRDWAPDVVLCMGRMANGLGAWIGRTPVRVVATLRSGKDLPWLYRRSLRVACHVVANSAVVARRAVEHHGVDLARVSVVPNAVVFPPAAFDVAERIALRERWGAGPSTVVVLCVAMFRREKNLRGLVEMMAALPERAGDWQLWLAGEGRELAAVRRRADALGLTPRVRFMGFCADPRPLYRAADVAALASGCESLPNFLVEAHAHGVPSVAFDAGGVAECGGCVVPWGERERFTGELSELITDPGLRARAGAAVASLARARFSGDAGVRAYEEIFRRCVGS
jgi:glycosyltransferase involved in cell wall biosynthesis